MQKKQCSKCGDALDLTADNFYTSKRDGFIQPCIRCVRLRCKSRYETNENVRRRKTERKVRIRNENRAFIRAYLRNNPCIDCGESDPLVLQFDHMDASKKLYDIANMVTNAWKLDAIIREISKCKVRCANCHARRTAKQRSYWKTEHVEF